MIRAGHYVRLLKQPETRDRPGPGWNDAMEKLIGKWVEISSIGQHIRVRGTERTWSYSFDWDIEVSETLPRITSYNVCYTKLLRIPKY